MVSQSTNDGDQHAQHLLATIKDIEYRLNQAYQAYKILYGDILIRDLHVEQ